MRTGRPGRPSPRGRRRRRRGGRSPLASASQERSPAIDHHTVRPVQATRASAARSGDETRTIEARKRNGAPRPPDDDQRRDDHGGASRATPSHPCRRRRRRRAPTREERRLPRERPRRSLTASRVGPRPWRATVPPRSRFPGREDLQFVYPPLTTASMAAGRLATLLGISSPPTRAVPHLPSLIAPCGSPLRWSPSRPLAAVVQRRCEGDWRRSRREVVRETGGRRLVRRRPRRQDLSARVLSRRRSRACRPTCSTTRTRRRRSAAPSPSRSRGSPTRAERSDTSGDLDRHGTRNDRRPERPGRTTTTRDGDRHDPDRHGHADSDAGDRYLGAVVGADPAPRARRARRAAPRGRLRRLSPPPDERRDEGDGSRRRPPRNHCRRGRLGQRAGPVLFLQIAGKWRGAGAVRPTS